MKQMLLFICVIINKSKIKIKFKKICIIFSYENYFSFHLINYSIKKYNTYIKNNNKQTTKKQYAAKYENHIKQF